MRNQASASLLEKAYPAIHLVIGDLRDPEICVRWIDSAHQYFGSIDTLVNNAAVQGPGGRFHELPWPEIESTLAINFTAPAQLIHQALKYFDQQGSGTIINLSGGGATNARPRFAPYGSAKCALVRLTETLAEEYPALRFYAVAPGTMKTQMTEAILKLGPMKAGAEFQPLKEKLDRGGDGTERAARLILWLAEQQPGALSGKLVSAIWDDYEAASSKPVSAEFWTLRRVDDVLRKRLLTDV